MQVICCTCNKTESIKLWSKGVWTPYIWKEKVYSKFKKSPRYFCSSKCREKLDTSKALVGLI